MSLAMKDTERGTDVLVKTWDGKQVQIMPQIGVDTMTTISMENFCMVIEYVLENTDLEGENDPRVNLIGKIISKGKIIQGYNKGGQRISLRD